MKIGFVQLGSRTPKESAASCPSEWRVTAPLTKTCEQEGRPLLEQEPSVGPTRSPSNELNWRSSCEPRRQPSPTSTTYPRSVASDPHHHDAVFRGDDRGLPGRRGQYGAGTDRQRLGSYVRSARGSGQASPPVRPEDRGESSPSKPSPVRRAAGRSRMSCDPTLHLPQQAQWRQGCALGSLPIGVCGWTAWRYRRELCRRPGCR